MGLQALDTRIIEKTGVIEEIPLRRAGLEKALEAEESESERTRKKFESGKKRLKDKEAELDDVNLKIEKLKGRTAGIKTNEEYQAHLKEIDSAEKKRFGMENEILDLMEEIEAEGRALRANESSVSEKKKEIEAERKKLDEEAALYKKELEELDELRAGMKSSIDPQVYEEYMALMNITNGLAVVEAKEEVCQGCNMNMMPQLFVEIKKNEEIMHCPHCRRMLYHKPEEGQRQP